MKRSEKSRRPTRNAVLFAVWLPPHDKQKLEQISEKTGVDQSKLTRHALGLLFEAYSEDKLQMGFPQFPRL